MFFGEEKMKTREDKSTVKLDARIFKTALFYHALENSEHSFFGAWSILLVHIQFTHSEGLKDFVNWYF